MCSQSHIYPSHIYMFPILQDAFISSKQFFDQKTPSWYGSIQTILRACPEIKKILLFPQEMSIILDTSL